MNRQALAYAAVVAAVIALQAFAAAESDNHVEESSASAQEAKPVTASDVAAAPKPHEARGLATRDPSRDSSAARTIARGLLTVPRWTLRLAVQPVRGAIWSYERFQLGERFRRVFFNESGTFGVFPAFFFETGFGFNTGARLVHRDLLGKREAVRVRVGWGGKFKQRYSLVAHSGQRLDRVRFELTGDIELRNRDTFTGIGDRDLAGAGDPVLGLDPLGADPVVRSRYRQRVTRVWTAARFQVATPLTLKTTAGIIDRKLSDENVGLRGDPVISDAYDITLLPGFADDPTLGYGELSVLYSTRRPASRYVGPMWSSTGWHLRAFGGYASGLGDDSSEFFRYGTDLQRHLDLFGGSRVVVLRLYGEGVSEDPGPRVPFSELPSLGGQRILRGYPQARFRDRYVATVSAEYQFAVNAGSYGYLFVDAGKAMPTLDADAFDQPRVGFGGGLQINSYDSLIARLLIAGSKDGDFLLGFSFEPQFDSDEQRFRPR